MNVYYNPASSALETVGEVEWSSEPYEFNLTVILRQEDDFYWADDSGCSCPTPFENHRFPDHYEKGTKFHAAAMLQDKLAELQEWQDSKNAEVAVAQLIEQIMR